MVRPSGSSGFTRYAYLFMDGIHVQHPRPRGPEGMPPDRDRRPRGRRQESLLAVEDGYPRVDRELGWRCSAHIKCCGVNEPKLVVGDGALGAWAVLRDVFPGAREQRCWFHAVREHHRLPAQSGSHSRAKGLLT